MSTVKVYGASDDLVEVEGDIREEFDHYSETPTYLHFSDGTIVSAQYNGGMWDVEIPRVGPEARVTRRRATNDDDDYSDVVTLTVPDEKLTVERWSELDPPTKEIAERLGELIEGGALEGVGRDELLTIWGIVQKCRRALTRYRSGRARNNDGVNGSDF